MGIQHMLPSTQTAIIAGPQGEFQLSHDVPVTPLADDEIIMKTAAVALNPVDTKLVGDFITPGAIFGFDCAGVIVAVGPKVGNGLAIGDRVCGSARGMNREKPLGGAFAEYVMLPADLTLRIPPAMTFAEAASLGTALVSACMSLFWTMQIPASLQEPAEKPFPVLVYGGSTATGTMLLQVLKICGVRTLTTCSPKNFDLVRSYGADEVFDYNSPTCAQDIREATRNNLKYAVDCITEDSTIKICYSAIGRAGGQYIALNPYPEHLATRKVIKPGWILATLITGEGSAWPEPYHREPDPEIRALAKPAYSAVQKLLDEGRLRSHPIRVKDGGLAAVLDGVEMLRKGEISGQKLVYCFN
ncbi:zinc-binding alcohol dehydrogenase family protein [Aspergillus alliaceus]|uniref:zinc-binding alcohol dehydrogenase family protein n=1 Tax=Petromyces alliaceus TaxID=209559 RepID=UPI0012A5BE14|nr:chaperonin 10-like protein [Aspergillus alliaceus]KAB8233737.1 chaperonin 10-like protein [Aspergillus alliaceus]